MKAPHLQTLSIEECIGFVQRRLALVMAASDAINAEHLSDLHVLSGLQDVAREAHDLLDDLCRAIPANIANWSPSKALDATTSKKKGGRR